MGRRRRTKTGVDPNTVLPTGSTLLNLACADLSCGGYGIGKMTNLIGDSAAGKSFLALTMLAEMAMDDRFKDYRFIYDDAEAACAFNMENLFGPAAKRILPPHVDDDGEAVPSGTVQDFEENLHEYLDGDRPFVYVLDSFDSITSEEEENKLKANLKARAEGGKERGDFGVQKPKAFSRIMRNICRKLRDSKSFLLMISQTRDNIDPMSFSKRTRSGGRALKFYASHEIWLGVVKTLRNAKYKRVIGSLVRAKVTKNKLTGKVREVEFPIYYDYGVDDIVSCVDFLMLEKHWKKTAQTIKAPELSLEGTKAKLISDIEDNPELIPVLKKTVGEVWNGIEENLKLNRKPRFT